MMRKKAYVSPVCEAFAFCGETPLMNSRRQMVSITPGNTEQALKPRIRGNKDGTLAMLLSSGKTEACEQQNRETE